MDSGVTEIAVRTSLSSLTLDELSDTARREHAAAEAKVAEAVYHAIRVGEVLLVARERVERGGWLSWVESLGMSGGLAYVYMRIAQFQDEVPEEQKRSVSAAYAYLRGRQLPGTGNRWKHKDETRQEAERLVAEGLPQSEVADLVGVNPSTVYYWTDADYRKDHQAKARARQRRKRAAAKALAEQEKREARAKAAKSAGGYIHDAYSQLRLHIEALDKAITETADRSTQAVLRDALGYAYKAEDKIAEALKVA